MLGAGSETGFEAWAIAAFGVAIQLWMVRPALDSKRWRFAIDLSRNSLIWGAISIAILVAFFQNRLALVPIIVVAVLVHEYGHVLAYRLAGHTDPKFRLIPFGGVAISNERPRSQAENAFVALMGPGFSLVLLVAAVMTSRWLYDAGDLIGAAYARDAAILIGALNAFNLLPFFPLDGGKTLRAVAMAGGPAVGRAVTIGMGAAFASFAITFQLWILLIFAAFGVIASLAPTPHDDKLPRMGLGACLLTLAAFAAILAAHAIAALPFFVQIALRLSAPGG